MGNEAEVPRREPRGTQAREIQVAGKEYGALESKFTRFITDELAKEVARANIRNDGLKLLPLVQRVFIGAGIRTFFGEKLLKMDPDFVAKFIAFDDQSWRLWFRLYQYK